MKLRRSVAETVQAHGSLNSMMVRGRMRWITICLVVSLLWYWSSDGHGDGDVVDGADDIEVTDDQWCRWSRPARQARRGDIVVAVRMIFEVADVVIPNTQTASGQLSISDADDDVRAFFVAETVEGAFGSLIDYAGWLLDVHA